MNLNIIKANITHLDECLEAVLNSDLGRVYFTDQDYATSRIKLGIERKQLYVAVNSSKDVLGYAWMVPEGMFGIFPYLRTIAVKEEYRGKGIGKRLLEYFESEFIKDTPHVYLLVSEFNKDAKRLYERLGYEEVGYIKDWVIQGIGEHIMMKRLKEV